MEIEREDEGEGEYDSEAYLQKVLQKFNISGEVKSMSSPLAPYFKLSTNMSPKIVDEREYIYHIPYASAVGSLMYTMVCTWADLSQALSMVSRYMHDRSKLGGHEMDSVVYQRYRRCWVYFREG